MKRVNGMKCGPWAGALAFLIASSPARSADINEEGVLKATETVVAEYRTYATCLSLDPSGPALVQEAWRMQTGQALEVLRRLKASAGLLARFSKVVSPANLVDGDMKLSLAIAYCHANHQTVRKFHEFGYTSLSDVIERAAKRETK